ncbi:unnamed protein product [[Candida] boidinii]|nr:hypothetical protein BVG19_g3449 [[Candida] boidinii]OWB51181.1 hypothetical protein B5S27_g2740 [[Candida] boidinii]OWB83249.1 hypothetical protein B5S33_g1878 [[Candida] boidinii]GME88344.1 unnamed protein product [[Candida] boidinii]
MSTPLSHFIKRSLTQTPLFHQHLSKRFASVANVRYIQSKAIIDKDISERYKEKLISKAKELGLKSAEELKETLKDKIETTKKELNKVDPLKELEDYEKAQKLKELIEKKKDLGPIDPSKSQTPFKTLDSFIDVGKFKDLNLQEMEMLWRLRFQKQEQSLAAIVPKDTFDRLYNNAKKFPNFVLPLPKENAEIEVTGGKGEGAPIEMHYVQWNFVGKNTTHCIITSLAEYKLHKEFARPHTSISFHNELADAKDVVLMNGIVEKEASINMQESQLLLLNIQRFYGGLSHTQTEISKKRLELVEIFNTGKKTFDVEELISLAQSMEN